MKQVKLLIFLLMLLAPMCGWAAEQGYAVFDPAMGTLTFSYGEKPAGEYVYDTDDTGNLPGWSKQQLRKIVFNPSFANARPASTARWMSVSEDFDGILISEITGLQYLNTSNVKDMSFMFGSCGTLSSLDMSGFDTSNVTNMKGMFGKCSALTSLDVSGFNTSNVTNMQDMFYGCSNLMSLDVSNFNTSNVTDMNGMFCNCSNLTSLDVSNFNTSNVTDMCYMFFCCSSLTSLDVSGFDTSNVTDMSDMFGGCSSLTSLDVSRLNTSKVTDMHFMFGSCRNMMSLDVSAFDTNNVTNMEAMFNYCTSLTSLDLSNFNTSYVTDMEVMFAGCNNLEIIYVSEKWITDNVAKSQDMFFKCEKLVGGKGTKYDKSHIDHAYAHIDGGADNPGYFTSAADTKVNVTCVIMDDGSAMVDGVEDGRKEVVIPKAVSIDGTNYTVTAIDNNAFKDNTALTAVTIPETVSTIGDGAFAGCSNLSAIYTYATEPARLAVAASRTRTNDASSVFEGIDKESCMLYVPKGCVEKYRAAEGWGEFVHIVEMEGTGINGLINEGNVFDVYDLSGRKVRTAVSSLDGLPKGIYIVNGRKVMK